MKARINPRTKLRDKATLASEALSGDFGQFITTKGYILSGLRSFIYNGTTLDMVLSAANDGAKAGDVLVVPGAFGSVRYRLFTNPFETRTPGKLWAEKA